MSDPNDSSSAPPPPPPSEQPVSYASPDTPAGYPGPYNGPPPDKDATTMGMLCHLLAIFTGFIGPLIIWLMKKEQSPFVDDQGKEALNFQIACFLVFLVCIPLNFLFCLGAILGLVVMVARIVFCIIATLAANKGVAYRYPLNLRLIK